MEIKALGGCCKKTIANYEAIVQAAKELGIKEEVIHVTDMNEIMDLGVMSTPGLVIDGKIMSIGRVLTVAQAKELINKAMNKCSCCCGNL
ncbi:MAG: thioredoxin family protein [Bacilli bacterium]